MNAGGAAGSAESEKPIPQDAVPLQKQSSDGSHHFSLHFGRFTRDDLALQSGALGVFADEVFDQSIQSELAHVRDDASSHEVPSEQNPRGTELKSRR